MADNVGSAELARPHVNALARNGTITAAFQRTGNGVETYSTRPLTAAEARMETVRWITESMRPFSIVEDAGLRRLLKTGRPDFTVTSAKTLQRDVLVTYDRGRERILKLLQVSLSLGLNREIVLTCP